MVSSKVNAFTIYQEYLSLKLHFESDSYDYFKFGGKTRAKVSTLEKRQDRYYFSKLARKKEYHEILLSNFVERKTAWIGELVEQDAQEIYSKWLKKIESLSYMFKNDLEKLDNDFKINFKIQNGQHPLLLKLYLQETISLETVVILNTLFKFTDTWNQKITEKYIWPNVSRKIKKYSPFLKFNRDRCKEIVFKRFA